MKVPSAHVLLMGLLASNLLPSFAHYTLDDLKSEETTMTIDDAVFSDNLNQNREGRLRSVNKPRGLSATSPTANVIPLPEHISNAINESSGDLQEVEDPVLVDILDVVEGPTDIQQGDSAIIDASSSSSADMGPYVDTRFEGMKLFNPSNSIPPDPIGAAGPFSLIAVVNQNIAVQNKETGDLLWTESLPRFFDSRNRAFDPKIVYDNHENRFVVIALDTNRASYSTIHLAVSKNDNPLSKADWYFQEIDSFFVTVPSRFPVSADYPGFEVDEEAIYITANLFADVFGNTFFVQSRLWIVDKGISGGFYDGGNITVIPELGTAITPVFGTYMPAEIRASDPLGAGVGVGTYLVGYSGLSNGVDEFLSVVRVDDPLGTPNLVSSFVKIGDIEEGDTELRLNNAPQLENKVDKILVNDRRALDAVWHDGALWCVFTIKDKSGVSKAYWAKMATSDDSDDVAATLDHGAISGEDIAGEETFTFFPSVAVNDRGIVAFGFSASSPDIYAGAYVVIRDDVNDEPGTVQESEIVREGVAPYKRYFGGSRNRWGDYSGISVDPDDEDCFWVYNEYADLNQCGAGIGSRGYEDGCWGTGWARLCIPRPAPTQEPTHEPSPDE